MRDAIYIHIPFCKTICSYCDFCKLFYDEGWSKKYLKSLYQEVKDRYAGEDISTIYIGGGTPSSLSEREIEYLLKITKLFHQKETVEFTFECNLNDITKEKLKLLKSYGVNRLSIGVQSFQENILDFLGRHHTYQEAKNAINLARNEGFDNINLDLIYAIPFQTLKDLKKDLELFIKLKPDHISTYSLMIEPHTLLSANKITPISSETDYKMYEFINKYLKKHHYTHYEVSNFAKTNKEAKHNLKYWNNQEYYGFGLSASGYIENIRYTNTKSLTKYLNGDYKGTQEILSKQDKMENEIMLGFRKMKGISKSEFLEKYNIPIEEAFPIKPLLKNKDLAEKNGFIYIPKEKIYIMNEILLKMI